MTTVSAVGSWRSADGTAGGCPQHPTFFSNPQFRLELTCPQQECHLTLTQAPGRSGRPEAIGFVILTASEYAARRKALGRPGGAFGYQAVVAIRPSGEFKAATRVSSTIKLERSELPFVVVPCTLQPGGEASFVVEVQSNFAVRLDLLPQTGILQLDKTLPREAVAETPALGIQLPPQDGFLQPEEDIDPALLARLPPAGAEALYEDAEFCGGAALGPEAEAAFLDEVDWLRPGSTTQGATGGPAAQVERVVEATMLASAGEWRRLSGKQGTELPGGGDAADQVLGALAVVASSPALLRRCLPPLTQLASGVLVARFWQYDSWVTVVTDDRLPARDGALLFGGMGEGEPPVLALLLKAYAKLRGSYAALRDSRISEILVDITGGVVQKLDVECDPKETSQLDRIWAELKMATRAPTLAACQKLLSRVRAETARRAEIRPVTPYVLLHAVCVGTEKLLCVRDPWATGQWSGRWRAGADEWMRPQSCGQTTLHHLQQGGIAHADAAVRPSRSGIFWMGIDEFCACFDRVSSCRLFGASVPRALRFGSWSGQTAGGCLNHNSWRNNPQYQLQLTADSHVLVVLTQPALPEGQPEYHSIGLCVLRGDGRRRLLTLGRDGVLAKSAVLSTREVALSLHLPRSLPSRPHVIVPYTFDPGTQSRRAPGAAHTMSCVRLHPRAVSPSDLPRTAASHAPRPATHIDQLRTVTVT